MMHLTAQAQNNNRFRASQPQERIVLCVDEYDQQTFHRISEQGELLVTKCDNEFVVTEIQLGSGLATWGNSNYSGQLKAWAEEIDESDLRECAKKYGYVDLSLPTEGDRLIKWHYEPLIGIYRKK